VSSGVFGDLSELRQLRHALQQCADGTAMRQMKALVGGEAAKLAAQAFIDQVDPFGSPWVPSKRAQKWALADVGPQTLRKSGDLLNSIAEYGGHRGYEETPFGIRVGTNKVYAATHNFGDVRTHTIRGQPRTFTFVKRQFIPTDALGNWGPALDEVITEYLLELFGG
jgi:phage gpG-like protein